MIKSYFRKMTSIFRRGPDFIIVGAQKSGTTFLYWSLVESSSFVCPATKKELHYFDGGLSRNNSNCDSILSYKENFPIRRKSVLSGESSPHYMFHPLAPGRIFRHYPDVKIICVLRDPSARAVSHYYHEKRKSRESRAMYEAFLCGEEIVSDLIKREDYDNPLLSYKSYLRKGCYSEQIERYYNTFGQEQIKVVGFRDLIGDPEQAVGDVLTFLGVPQDRQADFVPRNQFPSKNELDENSMKLLDEYYLEEEIKVNKLLSSMSCQIKW